jgi:hypothetical protein
MPLVPSTAPLAGVQSVVVAAAAMGFGYLLADAVIGRRDLDVMARWALAFPALAGYSVVLVLLHIATGGRILSTPPVIWVITIVVAAGLVALKVRGRTKRSPSLSPEDAVAAGLLVLAGAVLWGLPVFRQLPLHFTADTTWHTGWASQFLNGEPLPTAPITGQIPNYYPWLFHALLALITHFTPGQRTLMALSPIQLLMTTAAVLALYALGRELTGRRITGAAASLFGALSGGLGFFLLQGVDVVVNPRENLGKAALMYQGDLLARRSYNIGFHNLAPPFPRDMGFVLLMAFLFLLVAGLRRRNPPLVAGAGIALGLSGLTGGEAFFVGMAVAAVASAFPLGLPRRQVAAGLLLPSAGLFALWAVPLAINYLRLGGFANITVVGPVDLPPLAILVSWGIVTPFALYGAVSLIPRLRQDDGARVMVALVAAAVGFLLLATLFERLGEGFLTLSRRHRYWPLLHLGLALLGAIGVSDLIERAAARRKAFAVALAVVVAALAVPSPLVGSLALNHLYKRSRLLAESLAGEPDTVLNRLAAGGSRCTAAIPRGQLGALVFSYTGYRLVIASWNQGYVENRARIRWREIYEIIPADGERFADNAILTHRKTSREVLEGLIAKYGVDVIVRRAPDADVLESMGYQVVYASGENQPLAVVWVSSCGRPDPRSGAAGARARLANR